ncbi:MAG: YibE/F family protein [Candidatus Levyibacteriota bacterium]
MRKILLFTIPLLLLLLLLAPAKSFAQSMPSTPKEEYFKARVISITEQGEKDEQGFKSYFQTLKVQAEDGQQKGALLTVENGDESQITKDQFVTSGQEIIVDKVTSLGNRVSYSVYDAYRLTNIFIFLIIFCLAVILIAGLKGFGSLLGMSVSFGIILLYIIPNILKGNDPLTVTLIGSTVIILITTYLAHGISQKTTIALASTLISIFLTAGLAILAVNLTNISGVGNEDAFALQVGTTSLINLKGLFLSGIIIATLGALNDITTTQAITILELKKTDPKLKFVALFSKGFSVGKEHLASLVNTLILAYVGSAFAVFIFFVLNPAKVPYWIVLNSELVSDEVVKIIAGSIGLLLSVPIVTFLASLVFSQRKA